MPWSLTVEVPHNMYISNRFTPESIILYSLILITAPKGYRIRLDFRDEFHIEKTDDCKYDFLELRDGPFGYSPLLGRYCGRQFPPLTLSSSRYLWIRFKSDETIEYKGFRAVYEFFKPDQDGMLLSS